MPIPIDQTLVKSRIAEIRNSAYLRPYNGSISDEEAIAYIVAAIEFLGGGGGGGGGGTSPSAIATGIDASTLLLDLGDILTQLNAKTSLGADDSTQAIVNGAIATGGTSQVLLAAPSGILKRACFEFVNYSTETLWIKWGTGAAVDSGYPVPAGVGYTNPVGNCPQGQISVYGAISGSKYAVWQNYLKVV